jgi:glycosyltransferase involved in cell wall biosynthesis
VKLLILLPNLETGGLASLAVELGAASKAMGMDVKIITLYESSEDPKLNLEHSSLKIASPHIGFLKPVTAIRRIIRMHKVLKKSNPDFVICLDPSSAFLCIMLKKRITKFRLFVGCYTPLPLLTRSDQIVVKYFYQMADLVVAPSTFTGNDLKKINSRINLKIIPNPFSIGSTTCAVENSQIGKMWDCLYLGRLSREKGVSQILLMAEIAPDLKFCIAGDGVEKQRLSEAIKKKNIKNIDMIGWKSPSQCLPLTHVLLLPSPNETFGIVIVESWLHGIPVVAFAGADGPRELITSMMAGGLVKKFEDGEEWVTQIRRQILNPLDDVFLRKVLERYSAHQIIREWLLPK